MKLGSGNVHIVDIGKNRKKMEDWSRPYSRTKGCWVCLKNTTKYIFTVKLILKIPSKYKIFLFTSYRKGRYVIPQIMKTYT